MVIIPEICIMQVSGIIRTFAADMRKIVLSIIMLGWLSSALRNIARERYFHKADCLTSLPMTLPSFLSSMWLITSRKHVVIIPARSTLTWDGTSPRLSCASGKGWYQEWGKPAIPLKAGDIIDIPEGVKHWHGAQADSWFQHLATHAKTSGEERNEWLEPVNEEKYNKLK